MKYCNNSPIFLQLQLPIIQTSLLEFFIIFLNTIFLTLAISSLASYYVVLQIFNIEWVINFPTVMGVYFCTGLFTMILIMMDTYRNLQPRVYPLIRNS